METFTRLRATAKVDRSSGLETDLDWSAPDELAFTGLFAPASTEVTEVGRAPVTSLPTIYAAFGVDVTACDRVEARGVTWEVVGDPADWHHGMTGWDAGTAIQLRRVDG